MYICRPANSQGLPLRVGHPQGLKGHITFPQAQSHKFGLLSKVARLDSNAGEERVFRLFTLVRSSPNANGTLSSIIQVKLGRASIGSHQQNINKKKATMDLHNISLYQYT